MLVIEGVLYIGLIVLVGYILWLELKDFVRHYS